MLSNSFFNKGLEAAKVRDLSGAVTHLKRSLEINKANEDARNLLGLVFFEMGETVAALSQWVISKHFNSRENLADYFMNKVQDNAVKLENMSQAIKKYNIALAEAKQGDDDLAIIQLKKVMALNPKFLRAIHLLALLYMRNNDYERAKKLLKKALEIDVANTTTLKYLAEIAKTTAGENQAEPPYWSDGKETEKPAAKKSLFPVSTYREDKPNAMLFVNLILGVIVGIAVVYYLIVPTIETNIKEEYASKQVDYSSELSSKNATISQLEKQVKNLTSKLDQTTDKLDVYEQAELSRSEGKTDFDSFVSAVAAYDRLKASTDYTDDELEQLAVSLAELDPEAYENPEAGEKVKAMQDDIFPSAAKDVYKKGKSFYEEGNYEEAERYLKTAVILDPESDTAMYYLAKTFQAVSRYEDAAYYYKLMLEICPNSTLKQYIPTRLHEMGMDLEEGETP
ncbi:MAG: tetratricopeptide repeat protein [Lachnospiraceae bacterium]|nr:tetratricopeptide repeat protein [Lachnospiraceae bacterium]